MREVDFSEKSLFCRWLGVTNMWELIQGEVKPSVKGTLEMAMNGEVEARIGCGK